LALALLLLRRIGAARDDARGLACGQEVAI
jgi:hypothetical protein